MLDDENALQPDLVYVSQERSTMITDHGIDGAPDLVVEVLSPSTRACDLGIKMRRYAASGVPHYWVADPEARSLTPYRLRESGYEAGATCGPGAVFEPDLFRGLRIPIDELWE